MKLPVQPPVEPMLAALTHEIPEGRDWLYEPKWDGFRAIVFWDGKELFIQSRDLKPLNRYFPELETSLSGSLPAGIVLDGEIVIQGPHGLDFDALLLRIHPAASRILKLSKETPSMFIAFDMLVDAGKDIMQEPQVERSRRLEAAFRQIRSGAVHLTPSTHDFKTAARWFKDFEGAGLDGIVAKNLDQPYAPGERVMVKVKHQRTADCVVGGFRWNRNQEGKAIGSLLLGLYSDDGVLQYVGHASNFKKEERVKLVDFLKPYRTGGTGGFGEGRTPGGPSRWSTERSMEWQALRPELACEVSFDHLQGERFRHAASFLRWRLDKSPKDCTFEQLKPPRGFDLDKVLASARK